MQPFTPWTLAHALPHFVLVNTKIKLGATGVSARMTDDGNHDSIRTNIEPFSFACTRMRAPMALL
jgi:hypothetical protein